MAPYRVFDLRFVPYKQYSRLLWAVYFSSGFDPVLVPVYNIFITASRHVPPPQSYYVPIYFGTRRPYTLYSFLGAKMGADRERTHIYGEES